MNWTTWLMRMSQWARNPPSPRKVKLVLGVIAVVVLIVGVEALGLWPGALTLDRPPRHGPLVR